MMSTPVRIACIIVLTLLYCLLPVAGAGGLAPLLSRPPLVALGIALLAMVVTSCIVGGNISRGVREDRDNRWVLAAFSVLLLLNGYLPALTDRLGWLVFDGERVRWIGIFLFAVGGVLRLWPVHVLGHRFSGLVAIQPGHALVTGGIYSVIRHPSYLGLLVNALGWALAFRSGVGVALTALTILPLLARIGAEERRLLSEFGADYEAFRRRTRWRLVPGVW
jgi:protein-S-isoprenylcysteine O-methyltransferase Ste14